MYSNNRTPKTASYPGTKIFTGKENGPPLSTRHPLPTTNSGLSPGLCGLYLDWGLLSPQLLSSRLCEKESTKSSPDTGVCSLHSSLEPELPQASPGEWGSAPCPLKSTLRSWTARNGWLVGLQLWVWVLFLRLSNGRVVFPLEGLQEAEPRKQPRPDILYSAKLSDAADGHLWGMARAQAPRLLQRRLGSLDKQLYLPEPRCPPLGGAPGHNHSPAEPCHASWMSSARTKELLFLSLLLLYNCSIISNKNNLCDDENDFYCYHDLAS